MKASILKLVTLVVLVSQMNLAVAAKGGSSSLKVDVIKRKGKVIVVHLDKASSEEVSIRVIADRSGKLVYQKKEKNHDLSLTKLDMGQLPAGSYTVEVFSGTEKYVRQIALK